MRSLVHGTNGRLRWGSRGSSAVRKLEYERSAGSLGKGERVGSEGGGNKSLQNFRHQRELGLSVMTRLLALISESVE